MMSSVLLLQLCFYLCSKELLATSLLTDVQFDKRRETVINDGQKQVNMDILRQLVNQETIIRMSQTKNLQMIMKDFAKLKVQQEFLTKEVANLKEQNKHLSEKFTELSMLKTTVDQMGKEFYQFKNMTSSDLSDMKTEVRYMSITLLGLNKDIQETNEIVSSTQDDLRNLSIANIQIKDLQKNVSSLITGSLRKSVAFHAYPSKYLKGLSNGQTVVFDAIVTNEGGGYNKTNGVFVCPVAGIYSIAIDALAPGGLSWMIMVNSRTVGAVHTQSADTRWNQLSRTAVVKLDVGDKVYIKNHKSANAHPGAYTGFSGVLTS